MELEPLVVRLEDVMERKNYEAVIRAEGVLLPPNELRYLFETMVKKMNEGGEAIGLKFSLIGDLKELA